MMGRWGSSTTRPPCGRAGDDHVTRLSAAWNIGANPNGGYAAQPVLRALCDVAERPTRRR